jgi:hypothetical protein
MLANRKLAHESWRLMNRILFLPCVGVSVWQAKHAFGDAEGACNAMTSMCWQCLCTLSRVLSISFLLSHLPLACDRSDFCFFPTLLLMSENDLIRLDTASISQHIISPIPRALGQQQPCASQLSSPPCSARRPSSSPSYASSPARSKVSWKTTL